MKPLPRRLLLALVCLRACTLSLLAHTPAQEMSDAAQNLLVMLTPEQKAKITFDFQNDERMNWFFTPVARKGLTLKEMTIPERHLAYALLSSALSQRGFMKASTIMSLEQTLGELEGPSRPNPRDPEDYHVFIFGTPGPKDPWGWRWEGHHVSLSFTIINGEIVTDSPGFFGSNPAEVKIGPRTGLFILSSEESLGFKLINSLTAAQQKIAIYTNTAPNEIVTSNSRAAHLLDPVGLPLSQMTPPQQAIFWELVHEYTDRFRPELATADFKTIQSAPADKLLFAWAGGLVVGQGHYYRIQGPTFLIEFDNTQDKANHIHTVWRDLAHDFGGDPLREHYALDHPTATAAPSANSAPKP